MVMMCRKVWLYVAIVVLGGMQVVEVFGQEHDYGTVPLGHRLQLYRLLTPLRPDFDKREARRFGRAIAAGRTERVREMIEQGANVNVEGRYGITPLYIALWSLNYEAFEVLIEAGADIYHQSESWGAFDLFEMGASLGDGRYIAALLQRSREIGGQSTAFYRRIVFSAIGTWASVGTIRAVLENIPHMSLIGSPYGHPAINAVTLRRYHKTILLVDYDPTFFDDDELRAQFIRWLEQTSHGDDEWFQARAELVAHLESVHGITVRLQHPEPSRR